MSHLGIRFHASKWKFNVFMYVDDKVENINWYIL